MWGILFAIGFTFAAEPSTWDAKPPPIIGEPEAWIPVLEEFAEKDFPMTTFAAASRMLVFFKGMPAKEAAYRSVIRLVDHGFPHPIQGLFLPADLAPQGDPDFSDAYNIYKSGLNQDRGMETWAQNYANAIDQKESPKFKFYQALNAYAKKDYPVAEENLRAILGKDLGPERSSLVKKAARTLARVYFDQARYSEALPIYQEFLLKLNPVVPADWMEAAWNLYHLQRYPESLGLLYNLESKASANVANVEKYSLRGLLYRRVCAHAAAEKLLGSFDREFGKTLTGIRMGQALAKFPQLMQLDVPGNREFRGISALIAGLRMEQRQLSRLTEGSRKLAAHLIATELKYLGWKRKGFADSALQKSAEQLVLMSEQLRFLQFDVQREKFNPNVVFRPSTHVDDRPKSVEVGADGYRLHWVQLGDFWRDERDQYRATLEDACALP